MMGWVVGRRKVGKGQVEADGPTNADAEGRSSRFFPLLPPHFISVYHHEGV
jgi:hypothetical protein